MMLNTFMPGFYGQGSPGERPIASFGWRAAPAGWIMTGKGATP